MYIHGIRYPKSKLNSELSNKTERNLQVSHFLRNLKGWKVSNEFIMYCGTNKHVDWFRVGLSKSFVDGNSSILCGLKLVKALGVCLCISLVLMISRQSKRERERLCERDDDFKSWTKQSAVIILEGIFLEIYLLRPCSNISYRITIISNFKTFKNREINTNSNYYFVFLQTLLIIFLIYHNFKFSRR